MSITINGVTVTFEADMREEESAKIITAIRQMRGVIHAEGHEAGIMHNFEVIKKLWEVLK